MARTLYLLRHAKSDWSDPSLADRDRPLAGRGRRAAAAMAEHVRAAGIRPELVLCSPARRARETTEAVLRGAGASVTLDEELYGADVDELVARISRLPDSIDSAMVVAHNPSLHELVERLSGDEIEKFPTGALATFTLGAWADIETAGAHLEGIVRPRDLA
jgi:phosphohistidine phosphatase